MLGRASRKWALFAPARVAYSGSARCRRMSAVRRALTRSARTASLARRRRASLSTSSSPEEPGSAVTGRRARSTFNWAATSATVRIQFDARAVSNICAARTGMVAGDRRQRGPVDARRRQALLAVRARRAEALLVASACALPQPVELGAALGVELLDPEQGELAMLGIDPGKRWRGNADQDRDGEPRGMQGIERHGVERSGAKRRNTNAPWGRAHLSAGCPCHGEHAEAPVCSARMRRLPEPRSQFVDDHARVD